MRRAGLGALALAVLIAGCRPAGPPPTAAPPGGLPGREPVVRVGIAVDTTAVEVGSGAAYRITTTRGDEVVRARAGDRWTFSADGAGRLTGVNAAGRRVGPVDGPLRVDAEGNGGVMIAGKAYRGGALLRAAGPGRITAINVLELEAYLLGVVPMEIGPRPAAEIEAVKAQAVAARTYAIGHLGSRESRGFDFYASTADQVYGGAGSEDPVVTRAVQETRGEIVTYDGLPILAYYHSTCGGRTAAIEEVWRRAPVPYLKSVSDRIEGTKDRYYCDISNRFRWSVEWSGEALREILARTLNSRANGDVRAIRSIAVTGWSRSGRARALRIEADGRTHTIPGDSIRWVLRPEPNQILNSTLFVLDAEDDGGEVSELLARGGGWGHGIGMCQMGAIGRARAGQDYRRILTTYYRDTEVVRLY